MSSDPQIKPLRILVVEDDEDDFLIISDLLKEVPERSTVCWEKSYPAGLSALAQADLDVCLLDYRLGARTGLDLLMEATKQNCRVPIILLTGTAGKQVDLDAMKAGAADYLVKGELTATQLERSIRYARER